MDKLEYIPGDLVSVYVGIKKYIVEVIGTENENEVLSYQIKFQTRSNSKMPKRGMGRRFVTRPPNYKGKKLD